MLLFIVGSCLLLAPALQGVWDFRTQFLFESAIFLSGGLWLFRESLAGRVPAFLSDRKNLPLFFAAFCSLLAALLSPVRALVVPEWWTFAAGLFVLALSGSLSAVQMRGTDLALRCSAWFIALLGLYQAFILKSSGVPASLTNPNALALFTLMLLPAALMWGDYFLLSALAAVLIRTQSAAALFALLAAAVFYARDNMRQAGLKKAWPAILAFFAVGALAASQLDMSSLTDRLGWWRAALEMFSDRPALGFGAGAFAYIYPAYHAAHAGGVSTVYAHSYYLEFLAENGFFAFFFWLWAIAARLMAMRGLKKYAVIAALAHSCVDFGLAVPANLFIFCYLLGGSAAQGAPESPGQCGQGSKRPAAVWAAAAAALACFAVLCGVFSVQLKLERLRSRAMSAVSAGDYAGAERLIEEAARLALRNPLVPGLLGRLRMREGFERKDGASLFAAAADLERAVILNPYNAGAWRDLERLYSTGGGRPLLEGLLKRKAEVFRR